MKNASLKILKISTILAWATASYGGVLDNIMPYEFQTSSTDDLTDDTLNSDVRKNADKLIQGCESDVDKSLQHLEKFKATDPEGYTNVRANLLKRENNILRFKVDIQDKYNKKFKGINDLVKKLSNTLSVECNSIKKNVLHVVEFTAVNGLKSSDSGPSPLVSLLTDQASMHSFAGDKDNPLRSFYGDNQIYIPYMVVESF